jgi:hypothetical protein
MSEDHEVIQNLPVSDGFDGYENDNIQGEEQKTSSSNRIIHGHRLGFTIDYKWLVDDDKEFPKTGELVAIETRRAGAEVGRRCVDGPHLSRAR